jgi:hypothetical protein
LPLKPATQIDDASYYLLDEICLRLCAAWPLVPSNLLSPDSSLYDLACHVSRLAHCTDDEAMRRLSLLRQLNVLRDRGKVDPLVMKRLRRAGARIMGIEEPLKAPHDEPESEEPEDNE